MDIERALKWLTEQGYHRPPHTMAALAILLENYGREARWDTATRCADAVIARLYNHSGPSLDQVCLDTVEKEDE